MTKKEKELKEINRSLKALLEPENDWLANLANSSALLFNFMENLNWVGFYLKKEGQLVLGPFQGQTACVRIDKNKGVCGTAFAQKKVTLVEDVNQFSGHIACDPNSSSEIVLPLIIEGEVIAVLDIDSPQKSRFDQVDKKYLEKFVNILIEETNFIPLVENLT